MYLGKLPFGNFAIRQKTLKKSKEDITKKDGTYALTKLLKESTE
jgi:hypothetical protein